MVNSAFAGCILLSGQGCALPTRVYLHEDIYDEGIERLLGVMEAAVVGDPLEPATQMGPVVTRRSQERILGIVERAVADGAGTLLAGGEPLNGELADGYFIAPTLFGDVDHHSELAREEIFGPVLSVLRFHDEDEVIAQANDSEFGLGAYVYTTDVSRAYRMATQLDAGLVVANGPAGLSPTTPFGGFKQSGYGREGGRQGLEEYLRIKNILLGI